MTIALTLLTSNGITTDGTSAATASVSPAANSFLWIWCATRHATTAPAITLTTALSGMTIVSPGGGNTHDQVDGISRVMSGYMTAGASPGSGTITLTTVGAVTATGFHWHVIQITDFDIATPVRNVVSAATGLTGTTGTVTFGAVGSANNILSDFFLHRANEAVTPRASWTEIGDHPFATPNSSSEAQHRLALETTGTATWASNVRWQGLGVEFVQSGGVVIEPYKWRRNRAGLYVGH